MPREGSLFDVPPAAVGRFRVQHQIGAGALGPVLRATDPGSDTAVAIKLFSLGLAADAILAVASDLEQLVATTPRLTAAVTPLAAGIEGHAPYLVTNLAEGDSLDVALREFGPAAAGDLVPRLSALAGTLDAGAERDVLHGAIHLRDVIVSEHGTTLTGLGVAPILARQGVAIPVRRPYRAPELETAMTSAAADQYALAAVAFEWMTGRRLVVADGELEVPTLPEVDAGALRAAFNRAIHPNPEERFESCRAFVSALSAALPAPEPKGAAAAAAAATKRRRAKRDVPAEGPALVPPVAQEDERAEPPEFNEAEPLALNEGESPALDEFAANEVNKVRPLPLRPEPARETAIADRVAEVPIERVPQLGGYSVEQERRGFGLFALLVLGVVGLAVGLGAGYALWGRPSAVRSTEVALPAAEPTPTTGAPAPTGTPPAQTGGSEAPPATSAAPPPPAAGRRQTPSPPASAAAGSRPPAADARPGRLLVRSEPSRASVFIDGERRGETPVAVRDLELGTRLVRVQRDGFVTEERRISLTKERSSRSVDVNLTRIAQAAPPPAPPPAKVEPPAATTGSLVIDSRPPGATVVLDGRPVGTTPVTLDQLKPGGYSLQLNLPGFLPFTTTVKVVAGVRVRVGASLTAQEKE